MAEMADVLSTASAPEAPSLLTFPCTFPIKVLGRAHPDFAGVIGALITSIDKTFDAAQIGVRPSRSGNYTALTCTVNAQNRQHLDQIYRVLCAHPLVNFVL